MVKGIIGKKVGMTQLFDENGKVVPVTVIEAGPCTVVQKKTVESDGYQAVQLGFGEVSAKKVNKAAAGHFKKANVAPKKTLREFRLEDVSALNVGDVLKADVFAAGDKVDVAGVSKGKGYQGVIKRFGQHRLRESHGTGPVARHAGSMGAISNPSRVFPGKRLPGHMGCVRVTVQNLTVVKVDTENNLIAVKGAVPGSKGKGYQGVIKRYGQHRLRESHGTGPVARHAGSNGSTSTPSRVFPGKRLPGHMGFVRVTVQNLTVVKVDTENNLIAVKGAVPGSKGTIVTLANSVKA